MPRVHKSRAKLKLLPPVSAGYCPFCHQDTRVNNRCLECSTVVPGNIEPQDPRILRPSIRHTSINRAVSYQRMTYHGPSRFGGNY